MDKPDWLFRVFVVFMLITVVTMALTIKDKPNQDVVQTHQQRGGMLNGMAWYAATGSKAAGLFGYFGMF